MHAPTSTDISNVSRSRRGSRAVHRRRNAFSLVELLVVIGIIVLLVGLLLVALKQAKRKADRTQTENVMNQFANACSAFQAEHGLYPGIIPDSELDNHEQVNMAPAPISSTENALLHLMGGYRILSPQDTGANNPAVIDFNNFNSPTMINFTVNGASGNWQVKVDRKRIGEGPVINGKPYSPYFTPGPGDLAVASYPLANNLTLPGGLIPDLVDRWGQPIIYLKQSRVKGPLCKDFTVTGTSLPQFTLAGIKCYTTSIALGELAKDQTNNTKGSILNLGSQTQTNNLFAEIVGHPNFYKGPGTGANQQTAPLYGQARGAFLLISAGPDGIYYSAVDGPGTESTPLSGSNLDNKVLNAGPRVLDDFDDVRVFGGG